MCILRKTYTIVYCSNVVCYVCSDGTVDVSGTSSGHMPCLEASELSLGHQLLTAHNHSQTQFH